MKKGLRNKRLLALAKTVPEKKPIVAPVKKEIVGKPKKEKKKEE